VAVKDKILEMVKQSAAREKPYGWLNYQPINLPGYEDTLPLRGRDCFDRSNAIFPHLRKVLGEGQLSVVDWGCNIGFFVFEAAKLGMVAAGYDADHRLMDACQHLAASNEFRFRPSFRVRKMSVETVQDSPRTDVVFCFSVLHHMKEPERMKIIEAISNHCTAAYMELDGPNYGRNALEIFFAKVEEVVETNDRYGSSTRKRKTWYCTNRVGAKTWKNLKERDFVHDRALFVVTPDAGPKTVIKRERIGDAELHTWLKTGLSHERKMYEEHPSPLFPKLISAGEDLDHRFIELEYVEKRGATPPEAVDELYDFLEKEKLFVVDFRVDSFIPDNGRLRMCDLEAVFPLEGTTQETIARHLKSDWRPKHLDAYDDFKKQRQALKKALCR
jgi:2-polyprenyl-3-methyl-5-hydroxy-6-metoxy-1,4-benzoquinol methylase